ncbi:YqiA/YcfP family alpha/beta fold hydrolase [Croceibacter atlanticus]|uniref:YqiA/YcfP family alpha/beta fold hydrolase n=1 Tax=Croceibacter atlanticus TaxID=313588 RepID=UPI002E13D346|nr:YqiA/YcfP family alpha/beta fold hydrolase [Croceibacter atlanticus]
MHILYLHGLDGSLSNEKRSILEQYGKVEAPNLDYREHPNIIKMLVENYSNSDFDFILGSSMGGFVGYHISNIWNTPSLLFNPALAYRSVHQDIPTYELRDKNFKTLVLGVDDDVITPVSTLDFISHQLETNINFNIKIRQGLGHRIPVEVFEEEAKLFLNQLI